MVMARDCLWRSKRSVVGVSGFERFCVGGGCRSCALLKQSTMSHTVTHLGVHIRTQKHTQCAASNICINPYRIFVVQPTDHPTNQPTDRLTRKRTHNDIISILSLSHTQKPRHASVPHSVWHNEETTLPPCICVIPTTAHYPLLAFRHSKLP